MPDGNTRPTGGVLSAFAIPSGPGVRIDTFGYAGYRTNPRYDLLLAKVIAWSPEGMPEAIRRARRDCGNSGSMAWKRTFRCCARSSITRISGRPHFDGVSRNPYRANSCGFGGVRAEAGDGRAKQGARRPGYRSARLFGAAAAIDPPRAGIAQERQSAPTPEGLVPCRCRCKER